MEDRLTKLEMFFSDHGRMLDEMSGEMFQQQKEIAQLRRQIEELKEQLESSVHEVGGNERPPHY